MKIAVISGGSRGIGKETATCLSNNGYKVYELSRTGKSTESITHIDCDLTNNQSIKDAISAVVSESGVIDLLINNAGYGISGAIEYTKQEDVKKQFDVNFFGLIELTQQALPHLRKSQGKIINISSVGGVFALPFQAFYSATKFALNGYTLALKNEVKRFKISVCAVMPGDTKSGFTSARLKNQDGSNVYGDSVNRSISLMEKDETNGMSASKVGKRICKIAKKRKNKPLYIIGFKYKVFYFLSKILPIRFVNYIVGKLYAK